MSDNNSSHSGHRQRLRNRFLKNGFDGLGDYESLELILTLCIPRSDVKQPAKHLLKHFGSLRNVLDASPQDLSTIPGIGSVTPTALKIIRETINLYLKQDAESLPTLNNSDKLETFWLTRLSPLKHEVFEVAYLDNQYRLMHDGIERLESGTIDFAIVYPRKVLTHALNKSAAAIVLAHNHPAGLAEPSNHDITLTNALTQAASPLNIEIIDHLIIAGNEIFSFRRNGYIKAPATLQS